MGLAGWRGADRQTRYLRYDGIHSLSTAVIVSCLNGMCPAAEPAIANANAECEMGGRFTKPSLFLPFVTRAENGTEPPYLNEVVLRWRWAAEFSLVRGYSCADRVEWKRAPGVDSYRDRQKSFHTQDGLPVIALRVLDSCRLGQPLNTIQFGQHLAVTSLALALRDSSSSPHSQPLPSFSHLPPRYVSVQGGRGHACRAPAPIIQ